MAKFSQDRAYQAFRILQLVFIVAPIIAGLDKFFFLFADWSKYLSNFVMTTVSGHDRIFMALIGFIEIVVGIGMVFKPRVFSYIVALWLLLIIINLILLGAFYDVALRDFGLMLSAIALGRLSKQYAL
jgi:hypothetical protein